jgi:hypothetical protein
VARIHTMSEHDAHQALTATARLRILKDDEDPNEGEPMTVAERRMRQAEARELHAMAPVMELLETEHTWKGRPDFTNTERYRK